MRLILAIGVLIASCVASEAAPTHHLKPPPRVVRAPQGATAPSSGFAVPGWSDAQTRAWLDEATGPRD
jgi:hypothetical protein